MALHSNSNHISYVDEQPVFANISVAVGSKRIIFLWLRTILFLLTFMIFFDMPMLTLLKRNIQLHLILGGNTRKKKQK